MNRAMQIVFLVVALVVLMFAALGVRIILQANNINLPGATSKEAEEEESTEESVQEPTEEEPAMAEEEPAEDAREEELPVAVRPSYVPRTEEIARASRSLRDKEKAIEKRTQQLDRDQDFLDLVYSDFLSERTAIEEKRTLIEQELETALKRSNSEIERLRIDLATVQQENTNLIQQHAEDLARLTDDRSMTELNNFKKMGTIFDSVKPENVAAIFVELAADVETGINTIVGIIYQMKERQAAKVMNALREVDPDLAAELVTQLQLRKPTERKADPAAR